MKIIRKRGDTSNILQVFIQDSSSSVGAGLTGLAFNTASLTAYYHKDTDTTATAIALVTMTVGTFTSSGFKEIDATNMPGWYQFCPPDAALSTSGTPHSVGFHLKGATNMAPLPIEVQLVAIDYEDAVRYGLTALPNATAGATNGLPLAVDSSGRVDVLKINGTSQTARDIGASVLLSAGSGTGQLDFTSGVVKANATQWLSGTIPAVNVTGVPLVDAKYLLGTIFATPATAGIIDANVKNINNVAAATPGATGGLFIAGTNAATTITTGLTTTFTGNLTGSVASVTGAVGSVTGNVGGNVVGSVASVTSGVTVTTNNDKTGYALTAAYDASKTAAQAGDAMALTANERNSVADVLLNRDMSVGTDSGSTTVRTPRQALRFLRNKWSIASNVLTVTKEDDSTASWTATVSTDATAIPIIGNDPAGP